jgi:prepilin-type N-terminal cleavage/methylation domain-containing protein
VNTVKYNKKFTLVELLVVIAVISVLAGLLLPALDHAMNQAKCISCANNLKQIGIASFLYNTDYNDYLILNNTDTGPLRTWVEYFDEVNDIKQKESATCPSQEIQRNNMGNYGNYLKAYTSDSYPKKMNSVKKHSRQYMFGDSHLYWNSGSGMLVYYYDTSIGILLPEAHGVMGWNILLADGHSESFFSLDAREEVLFDLSRFNNSF